jgi:hypothetical protein
MHLLDWLAQPEPSWHLQPLWAFLEEHLPRRAAILDAGADAFTVDLLRLEPRELVGVAADPRLWDNLRQRCAQQGVCFRPLKVHGEAPRWVLPRLTAAVRERNGRFDLVRFAPGEAWPSASLELAHAGGLLRRGGYLMLHGLGPRRGPRRRAAPRGYRRVLEFRGGLVFEKYSHRASLHEWPGLLA